LSREEILIIGWVEAIDLPVEDIGGGHVRRLRLPPFREAGMEASSELGLRRRGWWVRKGMEVVTLCVAVLCVFVQEGESADLDGRLGCCGCGLWVIRERLVRGMCD
jgi:hypothetical protein